MAGEILYDAVTLFPQILQLRVNMADYSGIPDLLRSTIVACQVRMVGLEEEIARLKRASEHALRLSDYRGDYSDIYKIYANDSDELWKMMEEAIREREREIERQQELDYTANYELAALTIDF